MLLAVIVTYLPLSVPRYLGYEIYNVVSGSMSPSIPVGSVIYVETVAPESVEAGDVIAFYSEGTVIAHRVVQNRYVVGEYVTKGDANAGEDFSSVPYADLIGRVAYHYPVVGALMALYASTVGKVYVLVFAACGVMFNLLAARLRDRRKDALRRKLEADMKVAPLVESVSFKSAKAKKRARIFRRVVMALLLAVFLFCAVSAGMILRQYQQGDAMYESIAERYTVKPEESLFDDTRPASTPAPRSSSRPLIEADSGETAEIAPIQVDFAALQADNSDVIGWIYCEGTVIDYPVLRGEDNDYYLHRDYYGNYSVFGSIFAESTNRADFQDVNTILYGHHMRNGSMFASLERWASQWYYEQHPVMWLLTPTQDYRIDLVAGYTTSATSDTYQVFRDPGEDFSEYIRSAVEGSDFKADIDLPESGRYVVLSTCAYVFDNARYVVHGLLVPAGSAGGVPLS